MLALLHIFQSSAAGWINVFVGPILNSGPCLSHSDLGPKSSTAGMCVQCGCHLFIFALIPFSKFRYRLQLQPGWQRGSVWPVWCADPELLMSDSDSDAHSYNLEKHFLPLKNCKDLSYLLKFQRWYFDIPLSSYKNKKQRLHWCAPHS